MTALVTQFRPLTLDEPADRAVAARRVADGGIVAHAFANLYAITTRGDAGTVDRVNRLKGRPPGQVASVTGAPAALWEAWDLDRLPDGLPACRPGRCASWSTPSSRSARSASGARRRVRCPRT